LILGSFATLYAASGSFEFSAMRDAAISPFWASAAFLLAGFGFGTKAGVVPFARLVARCASGGAV